MVKETFVIASIDRTIKFRKMMAGVFFVTGMGPRMILEIFIRKELGKRYFSFMGIISTFILFSVLPFFFPNSTLYGYKFDFIHEVWQNLPWFIFTGCLLAFGIKRRNEIERRPSIYVEPRFTLYEGDIHPFFLNLKVKGRLVTLQEILTVYEPLAFLLVGVLCLLFGFKALGFVIIVCSILYSISYRAAIFLAENELMDILDSDIASKGISEILENGRDKSSQGYRPTFAVPEDPQARQNIYDLMRDDKNVADVF